LLWTDGSIGAISTADLTTGELKSFTPVMPIRSLILREKRYKRVLMVLLWLQPKQLQEMRFFTSIPILLFISDLKYRSAARRAECLWSCNLGTIFSYIKDLMKIVDGCTLLLM
jgi:hypothetical protein